MSPPNVPPSLRSIVIVVIAANRLLRGAATVADSINAACRRLRGDGDGRLGGGEGGDREGGGRDVGERRGTDTRYLVGSCVIVLCMCFMCRVEIGIREGSVKDWKITRGLVTC